MTRTDGIKHKQYLPLFREPVAIGRACLVVKTRDKTRVRVVELDEAVVRQQIEAALAVNVAVAAPDAQVRELEVHLLLERVVVALLQCLAEHLVGVVPAGLDVAAASPVRLLDLLADAVKQLAVGDGP